MYCKDGLCTDVSALVGVSDARSESELQIGWILLQSRQNENLILSPEIQISSQTLYVNKEPLYWGFVPYGDLDVNLRFSKFFPFMGIFLRIVNFSGVYK